MDFQPRPMDFRPRLYAGYGLRADSGDQSAARRRGLFSDRQWAIVIAITVVLVIVLVWVAVRKPKWGHAAYWKAHFQDSPDEIYARSGGDYDDEAALALERTERRLENPRIAGIERARDHHRAARILSFGLLPILNPLGNAADRARVRNEIARHNEEMLAEIAREMPRHQRLRARDIAEGRPPQAGADPEFMLAELLAGELLYPVRGDAVFYDEPFAHLRQATTAVAAQTARERQRAARAAGETPGLAAELYLDMAKTHTDDTQNAHDPMVTAAIRAVTLKLRNDAVTARAAASVAADDIAAEFAGRVEDYTRDPRTGNSRPSILEEKVLPVIARAKDGEELTSPADPSENVPACSVSNLELLRLVWARAHHPRNSQNAQLLRESVFSALADSWSKGMGSPHIVCVQGRMSRLAGALALLDFDKDTWMVGRSEDIRNEIFDRARAIMHARALEISQDAEEPPAVRAAAAEILPPQACSAAAGPFSESEKAAADEAVAERIRAAMVAEADRVAENINSRTPGAIRAPFLESLKNDLMHVL